MPKDDEKDPKDEPGPQLAKRGIPDINGQIDETAQQIKEIKFRPGTEEGDYQVKLRNLIRFLEDGDKAKVSLRFRGREIAHQELGLQMLKRIEADLEPYSVVEQFPKMEGKQMSMMLAPKKRK